MDSLRQIMKRQLRRVGSRIMAVTAPLPIISTWQDPVDEQFRLRAWQRMGEAMAEASKGLDDDPSPIHRAGNWIVTEREIYLYLRVEPDTWEIPIPAGSALRVSLQPLPVYDDPGFHGCDPSEEPSA